jgi:hypothetical protein
MAALTDALRNGRYGLDTCLNGTNTGAVCAAASECPGGSCIAASLASWVTWVAGFSSNPTITGSSPNQTVSVASASGQSVATLSAAAAVGATTVTVNSVTGVNTTSKSLLLINGQENAIVTNVVGTTVTIDTDPTTAGNQGLANAYPANTPVYRVDVSTFSIATNGGISQLMRNDNQGGGAVAIVDDITGLSITTVTAGKQYQAVLTGLSSTVDPLTQSHLQAILTSNVVLAN